MDAKKIRKLKRLVFFIVILLVVIISLNVLRKSSNTNGKNNSNNSEIKTDATINVAEIDSGRFIKDYTNPTSDEIAKAYDTYGYGECYFTDEGLFIKADEYGTSEDRLITNVWLSENKLVSKVKKPDVGTLETIEIGQTYLKIYLCDISEKDLKKYIKEIDDIYSNEIKTNNDAVVYKARDNEKNKVEIKYNAKQEVASILYNFK